MKVLKIFEHDSFFRKIYYSKTLLQIFAFKIIISYKVITESRLILISNNNIKINDFYGKLTYEKI